tara:strand:+ start:4720 stop:7722 length:3003 start_codon:yes stop_codon:yes gene_type:complete
MFALKFVIAILILLFVFYIGISIIANDLSLSERLIQLIFYIIIVIVILNMYISWVTYYKTIDKIGAVGDPGLPGDDGKEGLDGMCSQSCGTKIAYNTIIEHCNNVLNQEIQALRGRVTLKYDIQFNNKDKSKKIKSDIKTKLTSDIEQKYQLKDFNILVELSKKNNNVFVIVLGNEILANQIKDDINNNTIYDKLNITYDNNEYTPSLQYEDMDIDSCIGEELDTSGKPVIIPKKIANDFFINKISQICNSSNYTDTLEKDHENKPNEYKLIEYLKNIIGEWVKILIRFKLKDNETNKVINIGLNFLMTKKDDLDSLNKYTISEKNKNGTLVTIPLPSPFEEIEKYDIWRWGTGYTNIPIVYEKCMDNYKLPQDKDPTLSIIYTNKYEKIWNSKARKDKWYSSSTYCPFNQMGENNENPNNIKECTYFGSNIYGNRHLYGKQEAFKSIQYGNVDKLSIYHPISENGIYYQDETGRLYYPVGSVWTGKMDDSERDDINSFNPKLKNKCSKNGTGPEKETILISGDIKPPTDYVKVWNSKDGCNDCQEDNNEVTIWEPIGPTGYIAMGHVATKGKVKPSLDGTPLVMCVPESCTVKIPIGKKIWDSNDLFKLDMSRDNTYDVIDRVYLNFYYKILENQYTDINEFYFDIDEMINDENNKYKIDKLNIHKVNVDKLNELKEDDYFDSWPSSKKELKIRLKDYTTKCANIEKKYLDRYKLLNKKSIKEIQSMDDVFPRKPLVTLSDEIYIYSAGAQGAQEESLYKDNINIKDDGGHNLFMTFKEKLTNDSVKDTFAYRINKECLHGRKAKPIEIPEVPGILNQMSPHRDIRKQAVHLFTYPQTIIIENTISENSPSFEPKRYYLSYANKTTKITKDTTSKELIDVPLYMIRAVNDNDDTIDYSNCKVIDVKNNIVDDEININNPQTLWIITNYNKAWSTLDFQNPVIKSDNSDNVIYKQINIQSLGYNSDNNKGYFAQSYNNLGASKEFIVTDGTYNRWIYKPV